MTASIGADFGYQGYSDYLFSTGSNDTITLAINCTTSIDTQLEPEDCSLLNNFNASLGLSILQY